jgi:predicted AAA+ superfamily ATPase
VLLLEGPRSVGKSTLLRQLADAAGASVLDLDDLTTRDAVLADPALFVGGDAPVFIDEYQKVPVVLDAIKAELNRDTRPGRFVLTGSARHDALPPAAQALTGRLSTLPVYPLSQHEIVDGQTLLLEQLFDDAEEAVAARPTSTTPREEYMERIAAGGFPLALARPTATARGRWFDDYVTLTLERDVRDLSRLRQGDQLSRLLRVLAGQTAQLLNVTRAATAAGLDPTTAESYTRLLEAVFLLHRLPPWGKTLRARAGATPKLHMLDSGVAARLLRLTPEKLARRDPTVLTELGHLLETFAVQELRKQASWIDRVSTIGHWRTRDHDEVDLIIESDDGSVVAVEVKTGSRVGAADLAPMAKLRDALGDAFVAGVALYLGNRSYRYDDRLFVMPVDRMWAS